MNDTCFFKSRLRIFLNFNRFNYFRYRYYAIEFV